MNYLLPWTKPHLLNLITTYFSFNLNLYAKKKKVLDSTRVTKTASSCGPLGFIVWTLYGVKCHIISTRPEREAFSSFSFEPKQKDFDGKRVSNKV